MKILVLTEGINFGGQQYYLINLFKECKKLDLSKKFEINLGYLFNESKDLEALFQEVFDKVIHFSIPGRSKKNYLSKPFNSFLHLRRTLLNIKALKYDIIFSNGFYSFVMCVILKVLNKKIKHIRLVGGDLSRNELFYFNSFYKSFPLYSYTDLVLTWPQQIDFLRSKGFLINTLSDFNSIYAVDSDLFYPKNPSINLKQVYNIEDDTVIIGWVGRIAPDLEINETLKLCSFISSYYPMFNYKLLIIGNGVGLDDLYKQINQYDLNDKFIHIPFVKQSELPEYYSIIDYEVLLDADPQGGSHIREAMACGRVAVSVDGLSGVQASLIQNNFTGLLVKPENRVEESAKRIVSMTTDERKKIGENARKFIEKNSYHKIAFILQKYLNNCSR